ncbi:MAG: P1 family peptidase, partial [Nocardioidaceae bacterium]
MSSYGRLGPARSGHLGYAARQPLGGCGLRTWIREIPGQTLQSADRCSLMGGHAPRRARDLGIAPGVLRPGEQNAISDVSGVLIGQVTLEQEPDIHTGVTAIVPAQIGAARRTLPCACFVGNGHGKLVGSTQVAELGTLETPIVLTATLSVFRAADAVLTHMMARPGYESVLTLNPVVGETNDGYLSNIRSRPVTEEHVLAALDKAAGGEVAEGCVGAGTGTAALGYKAGVGTSSRVVDLDGRGVTVGVLVQANFSGTLEVLGVPMPAAELLADAPEAEEDDGEQGG